MIRPTRVVATVAAVGIVLMIISTIKDVRSGGESRG
jgi:hypothetical protein